MTIAVEIRRVGKSVSEQEAASRTPRKDEQMRVVLIMVAALAIAGCDGHALLPKACKHGKPCGMSCIPPSSECHK